MNPWAVVALVTVGVCGSLGFSALGHPDGGAVFALVSVGFSILGARLHTETRKELQTLRASMRPPSLVDPKEIETPRHGTPRA